MHTRDFKSNDGTIKSQKNMKDRYCLQPFTNVDIHSNNGVRCCSESWMPEWIGDFSKNSIKEIWNMDKTKKIRQSILDGTYKYCDWHQCPFYSNDEYYLFSKEELMNPEKLKGIRKDKVIKYLPWVKYILNNEIEQDLMPANYNLAYDETCNLKCPSCRNHLKVYVNGKEYNNRLQIHNKFLNEMNEAGLDTVAKINLTGAGEPFASKIFKDFLINFENDKLPNMDINIQSNGLLFTKELWEQMPNVHNNINEVIISLDASENSTYECIRVNGDYDKLLDNLKFMKTLKEKNNIKRLMLAFVVQEKNYKEMINVINIGKSLNADLVIFNLLNDWMSWDHEEYEKNAIWKSYHPKYNDFLDILKDDIFDDEIVDLGNMYQYRRETLNGGKESGIKKG